jgi:hypothetical protein
VVVSRPIGRTKEKKMNNSIADLIDKNLHNIIVALGKVYNATSPIKGGFQCVEYFTSNDAKPGKERRYLRVYVWGNRTVIEWGFAHRYITCTAWKDGNTEWKCSIPWVKAEWCRRLVELDGDWEKVKQEMK